eukprot:m.11017 g.11017  ORF g.11017 m.11017 type:complete len:370 (-) comp6226_c0_seq1:29-1138(-)
MSRVKAAEDLLQEAEKSVKTSMFKWKPDWEIAGDLYDKAALAFRTAKELQRSKETYIKAANAHKQYKALHHAGRSMEQASAVAKDQKMMDESVQLIREACLFFQEHGSTDQAAVTLEKAGALAESAGNTQAAVECYLDAVSMRDMENRDRMKKIPLTKAMKLLAKTEQFEKCLDLLGQLMDLYQSLSLMNQFGLCMLGGVVVNLKMGDYVGADRFYQDSIGKYPAVATDESSLVANELLSAWDEMDDQRLAACLAKQHISFMENELAKLAKSLTLDKAGGFKSKGSGVPAPLDNMPPLTVFAKPAAAAPAPAPAPAAAASAAPPAARKESESPPPPYMEKDRQEPVVQEKQPEQEQQEEDAEDSEDDLK